MGDTSSGCISTQIAPIPTPRYETAAVLGADRRIYVVGGLGNPGFDTDRVNTVEAYNSRTNSWSCSSGDGNCPVTSQRLPPMPTARDGLAAVLGVDQRIYVIGGQVAGGAYLNTIEAYSSRTHRWSCSIGDSNCPAASQTLAPMPTARVGIAAVAGSDGRIYVMGGVSAHTFSDTDTVEAYDPVKNAWICSTDDTSPGCSSTLLAPMPTARRFLAGANGADGRIYAIGGSTASIVFNTVEAYSPRTNRWATVTPMPNARVGIIAAAAPDHRIYVVGGYTNLVEAYDPKTGKWSCSVGDTGQGCSSTLLAPMPTARQYLGGTTGPHGRIYAISGGRPKIPDYVNTVEAYTVP